MSPADRSASEQAGSSETSSRPRDPEIWRERLVRWGLPILGGALIATASTYLMRFVCR